MRRPLIVSTLLALGLVLSGCATGDPTPTAAPADSKQDSATDEQVSAGGTEEVLGQVTLGDQSYEFTEVIRCERFENETVRFDLEVIALGRADGGAFIQLDVYQEQGSTGFDWSGPEGFYSSDGSATVTISGDRITGSGAMREAETESSSFEMSFDLALPADFTECR